MIDPANITNFNRDTNELQEFLLFCICVAGKSAIQQAQKLDDFLFMSRIGSMSPFEWINHLNKIKVQLNLKSPLKKCLENHKLGQYSRLEHAFTEVAQINDLTTVSLEQLENIKGIGPKTARFFLVHSRSNQQYAVLDTHVLKYMRAQGIKAPKMTPVKQKYYELEKIFLDLAAKSGKSVAEFDLQIWKEYAQI